MQQIVIAATESKNGGAIIFINSKSSIWYFVYRYRFCGFPNGVSIPPKLAAIFCIINVNAIYRFLFAVDNTKYPSGRNVRRAMSLAINMEPMKVMYTNAKMLLRVVLNICITFFARI